MCEQVVVNINQHLMTFHKLSRPNADRMMFHHAESLKKTIESKIRGETFRSACPLPGCLDYVVRMDKHMQRVHKLAKDSAKYRHYLKRHHDLQKEKKLVEKETAAQTKYQDNIATTETAPTDTTRSRGDQHETSAYVPQPMTSGYVPQPGTSGYVRQPGTSGYVPGPKMRKGKTC